MGVATAAGTILYIGTTAAVGSTDSFTQIGELVNLPEFGRTYAETKYSPLNTRGVQKFKGSFDDGSISVELGKDIDDAGQTALLAALATDFDYNFKVLANDAVAPVAAAGVSISAASPGVVTDTAHGLVVGTPIMFTAGSGTLPTGIVDGTTYYVKTVLTANTYNVSTTSGGSAINTTGSPTGTYTRTTVPVGSSQLFKAKVMSFTNKYGTIDSVISVTAMLSIKSGSLTDQVHVP